MSENEKQSYFEDLADQMEIIDHLLEASAGIAVTSFEDVDPEFWEIVQNAMTVNLGALAAFKHCLTVGAKLAENDAFVSHLTAVATAE